MGKDADVEGLLTVNSDTDSMYIYKFVLYAHSTEPQTSFHMIHHDQAGHKMAVFWSKLTLLCMIFNHFPHERLFSDSPGDAWSETKMWESHFQVLGLKLRNKDCEGALTSQVIIPLDH